MNPLKQFTQTIEVKHSRAAIGKIFENTFKDILKEYGLKENKDFKDLRNAGLLESMENGLPVEDIQPRMGHSSIKTTLGYAKVETPKKIINLLDDEYFTDMKIIRNNT